MADTAKPTNYHAPADPARENEPLVPPRGVPDPAALERGGACHPSSSPSASAASSPATGRPSYYYLGRDGAQHPQMLEIRLGFVRKVYGILLLQLLFTFGVIALCTFVPAVKNYFRGVGEGNENGPQVARALMLTSLVASIVFIVAIACCEGPRRVYPYNYICLGAFTVFEAVICGTLASFYDTQSVAIAFGITMLVVTGLTLFAFQTRIDFTGLWVYLFVFILVVLIFAVFAVLFQSKVLMILYCCLGVLAYSLFLVFDTQMVVGMRMPPRACGIPCCAGRGNDDRRPEMRKHFYSIDDYTFAALNLYIDFVQIFLFVLQFVGMCDFK